MALADFQRSFANVIERAGGVFVKEDLTSGGYAVTGVDTGADEFTVSDSVFAEFAPGETIEYLDVSTTRALTVASASVPSAGTTVIKVNQDLSGVSSGGRLYKFVYHDLGVMKNVQLQMSPVSTEGDVGGRQKELSSDVQLTFMMQQTTSDEIAAMLGLVNPETLSGNYPLGHELAVVEDKVGATELHTTTQFALQHCMPSMTGDSVINFTGGESMIGVQVTGRIKATDIKKLGQGDIRRIAFGP
jgi:hypothetical protein